MRFIFTSFFAFVIWVIIESFIFQKFNSPTSLYHFGFYNTAVFFLALGLFYSYSELKTDRLEFTLSYKDYVFYGMKMLILFLILGVFFTFFYYEYFNRKILDELLLSIKTNPNIKTKQLNLYLKPELLKFELNVYYLSFKFVIYNLMAGIIFILIFSKLFMHNRYKN
ncbi:MAG: hypothetical protein IAE65_00780 [Ignavibacteria bacterium]|nr:hypothetical protein [Ignavibacteria bacterium]